MSTYIYRIIAAAIICSIVHALFRGDPDHGKRVKMICGLFLMIVIISPLRELNGIQIEGAIYKEDGAGYAAEGSMQANVALREIIIQRCETYIVEKATSMGADINVEVSVSDDTYPTPCAITICGAVAPYTKTKLQEVIMDDLGIAKEQQTWI